MNIQEFSHQLGREDDPSSRSPLLRALRTLSAMEMDWLRDLGRVVKSDWGVWTGFDPGECTERADLR